MSDLPNGIRAIRKTYGDPRGAGNLPDGNWVRTNLAYVAVPWPPIPTRPMGGMRYAYDTDKIITTVRLHRAVREIWTAGMRQVWEYARAQVKAKDGYGRTTAQYDLATYQYLVARGLDLWGGSYVWRFKRGGGSELSAHAYGIAWDIDPAHNGQGTPGRMPDWWVRIWEGLGCTWGGRWNHSDPMHVQACSGY